MKDMHLTGVKHHHTALVWDHHAASTQRAIATLLFMKLMASYRMRRGCQADDVRCGERKLAWNLTSLHHRHHSQILHVPICIPQDVCIHVHSMVPVYTSNFVYQQGLTLTFEPNDLVS